MRTVTNERNGLLQTRSKVTRGFLRYSRCGPIEQLPRASACSTQHRQDHNRRLLPGKELMAKLFKTSSGSWGEPDVTLHADKLQIGLSSVPTTQPL